MRGAVVGPTATGGPVTAVLPVIVDGLGPAVTCASPAMGAVSVAGRAITLSGSAIDGSGLADLKVNGAVTAIKQAPAPSPRR